MVTLLALLAMLSSTPKYNACADECEVLDMSLVREQGCKCVCWDDAERREIEVDNPECIDRL